MANDVPPEQQPPLNPETEDDDIDLQFASNDQESLRTALERLRSRMQTEAQTGILPADNAFDEPYGQVGPSDLLDEDLQQAQSLFASWESADTAHLEEYVVEDQETTKIDVADLLASASPQSETTDEEPTPEPPAEKRRHKILTLPQAPKDDTRQMPVVASETGPVTAPAPWTLEQFFNGEIDLDIELSKRFDRMPILASAQFRTLGARSGRKVATLSSQDGGATLIIDVDAQSKAMQLSFTLGAMLTLRFQMNTLSNVDRQRWLDLMQREQGGLAFLWGPERWRDDYLICISRQHYTNIYAFSKHNFEAAIRMTPTATRQLLEWFNEAWDADDDSSDDQPLLTW